MFLYISLCGCVVYFPVASALTGLFVIGQIPVKSASSLFSHSFLVSLSCLLSGNPVVVHCYLIVCIYIKLPGVPFFVYLLLLETFAFGFTSELGLAVVSLKKHFVSVSVLQSCAITGRCDMYFTVYYLSETTVKTTGAFFLFCCKRI